MRLVEDVFRMIATAETNERMRSVPETTLEPEHISGDLVSYEVQYWIRIIVPGVVTPSLFLFGAPANLLCAIVFYKQSLRERINVCLFALALSDTIALSVDFLLAAEHIYRTYVAPSTALLECLVGLTGFVFASQFLSCVIACERCFCVVSPFKAQKYLKTSTMAVIVVVSCLVIVGGLCVIAGYKHTTVYVFDPLTNETARAFGFTKFYLDHKEVFDPIDIFVYSTAFPIVVLVVIICATSVTVIKLYSAVAWRKSLVSAATSASASASKPEPERMSSREITLTKMLIATSVLFIICLLPNVMYQITHFVCADFKYGGRFSNLSSFTWEIVVLCRVTNRSVNFMVYFLMGSRFRDTLREMCSCFAGVKSRTESSDGVKTSRLNLSDAF